MHNVAVLTVTEEGLAHQLTAEDKGLVRSAGEVDGYTTDDRVWVW